jgi:hypothetical protein
VALDETGLVWSGSGCGSFGKVSETTLIEEYPITESEATYLTERFGFDDFRENPYNP